MKILRVSTRQLKNFSLDEGNLVRKSVLKYTRSNGFDPVSPIKMNSLT